MINNNFEDTMDKIITVKYFQQLNSATRNEKSNENKYINLEIDEDIAEQLGGFEHLKNIEALNVKGKSMEPLIKDNSLVFIDRSKTSLSLEKENVYVINTPQGLFVKKVKFIPTYNKLQLISENKLYSPELFDLEDVKIIGKVIGRSSNETTKEAA